MRIKEDTWYECRNGNTVYVYKIKTHNDAGERVTFPVKGIRYWFVRDKRKEDTSIWTITGEHSIFKKSPHDLVKEID